MIVSLHLIDRILYVIARSTHIVGIQKSAKVCFKTIHSPCFDTHMPSAWNVARKPITNVEGFRYTEIRMNRGIPRVTREFQDNYFTIRNIEAL